MLKSDFHAHSNEDHLDCTFIKHNAYQLIDEAARLGYEVFSLTLHEKIHFPRELREYAKKRNILLIPGVEAAIGGRHVVVINPPLNAKVPYSFDQLENLRNESALTIAAHPFFLRANCLGEKLIEHIDLFDAIEHCHFYTKFINRNKKAIQIAERFNKPVVANSDAHGLFQLNTNYTLIDAEKNIDDILEAIRKNKLHISTRPLTINEFSGVISQTLGGWLSVKHLLNKMNWRKKHPII